MRLLRQLTRGLRALTNRSATDREIDDEVQRTFIVATNRPVRAQALL